MARMRTRRRQPLGVSGERGLAILEMAFILPIFLLLTIGLAEFSRAWLVVNTMNHATREAVRLAATTPSLTANNTAVIGRANTILAAAGIAGATVTNTVPAGIPPQVQVDIAFTYAWITGISPLGFNFTGTIPLASQATMRYER